MSVVSKRKYILTFILDLRGFDDPIETLIDSLKSTMEDLGAEVSSTENLGSKDFSRTPDQRFTSGHFLKAEVEAEPNFVSELNEKLRLDKRIHRIFSVNPDN